MLPGVPHLMPPLKVFLFQQRLRLCATEAAAFFCGFTLWQNFNFTQHQNEKSNGIKPGDRNFRAATNIFLLHSLINF
jgi:hypothetical protein